MGLSEDDDVVEFDISDEILDNVSKTIFRREVYNLTSSLGLFDLSGFTSLC
jgi:hypothetical protein